MDSSQRVRAILSFVHAADAGSFSAAGRNLGITSAAVSKNVASLEKALGVRLMNRTTRVLQLTDEGDAFLRQARVALDALDVAVDAVTARRQGPSGRVRISTSSAFGRDYLMPALPSLLSLYPELSVEVDFDDRVVDFVRDGYDIAIRGGAIPSSNLVSKPVFRMSLALVASPEYLERRGVPGSPQDLMKHKLIARRFLGGKLSTWGFCREDGSVISLDPSASAVLILSAPEAVLQAALAGVGIAQIGLHMAWEHLQSGTLKLLLHQVHHAGAYEMVMQYPHRALIAPRVRATLDYLSDAFAADSTLHISTASLDIFSA